eukprot:9061705-Karenia_brevis.AAC.1
MMIIIIAIIIMYLKGAWITQRPSWRNLCSSCAHVRATLHHMDYLGAMLSTLAKSWKNIDL